MRISPILAVFSVASLVSFGAAAAVATYGGKTATLPAPFSAKLAAVCQSQALVLTTAAKTACTSGAFPRVTAAATAFVNIGIGAELNTLMRQLPTQTAAK
jgi:hypothetical protein